MVSVSFTGMRRMIFFHNCVCMCVCVCEDNVFNQIGYFSFIYIHARKRSICHAKNCFEFEHSISYCKLGALADRPMYQPVSAYFPMWVFYSTFASVCCWECVQTTPSYFQMKRKDGQYIVTCMHLESTVCCVAL